MWSINRADTTVHSHDINTFGENEFGKSFNECEQMTRHWWRFGNIPIVFIKHKFISARCMYCCFFTQQLRNTTLGLLVHFQKHTLLKGHKVFRSDVFSLSFSLKQFYCQNEMMQMCFVRSSGLFLSHVVRLQWGSVAARPQVLWKSVYKVNPCAMTL